MIGEKKGTIKSGENTNTGADKGTLINPIKGF